MANEYSIDLSQDIPNALTAYADQERAKLIPRNDYNAVGNQYSSTNADALADGDRLGRGTIDDVVERKNEIKINKFNSSQTYPNFPI